MNELDIIGLAVGVVGILIALAIAWHIYCEEMGEGDSPDDDSYGGEPLPRMQNEPDDDHRFAALDAIDGRPTRRRGEPMPACTAFPRGTRVEFSHGRREISGVVTGGAGRRLRLRGELPGNRAFLTERRTHEVRRIH